MTLNEWAAQVRLALFDDLKKGVQPSMGQFDAEVLKEGRTKSPPQVGSTRYEPRQVFFEFVFPDAKTSATILTVTVEPPERIVFLPVPDWVIENIWQGSIEGSAQFESQAHAMVERLAKSLEEPENARLFGPQPAKRRE